MENSEEMKRALVLSSACLFHVHSGYDFFLESFLPLPLNQILPDAEIMVCNMCDMFYW
jgi:hypothetical protein